jgi:AcrR family transcriptional regulator
MCGRKRDDGIDLAVLVAARGMVASHGYANFSVEAVAAQLGIAKSTVYKRWASRQELLAVALAEHLRAVPVSNHRGEDRDRAPLDGRAQLVDAIGNELALVASPEGRAVVQAVFDAEGGAPVDRGVLRLAIESRRASLRNLLGAAADSGSLAAGTDVNLVADMLFAATWGSAFSGMEPTVASASRMVDALLPQAVTAGPVGERPTFD